MHLTPDQRLILAGHAVALINGHLPTFGVKYRDEDWSASTRHDDCLSDHIPPAIRRPFDDAVGNAARFLAQEFALAFTLPPDRTPTLKDHPCATADSAAIG